MVGKMEVKLNCCLLSQFVLYSLYSSGVANMKTKIIIKNDFYLRCVLVFYSIVPIGWIFNALHTLHALHTLQALQHMCCRAF